MIKRSWQRIIIVFVLALFGFFKVGLTQAQEDQVIIHFFWAKGCSHCAEEKVFLNKLVEKYPQLMIKGYELTSSQENLKILQRVGEELEANVVSAPVPFTVIGKEYLIGYLNEDTTGRRIEAMVNDAFENGYEDFVTNLLFNQSVQSNKEQVKGAVDILKVPVFGDLDLKSFSLPLLTFIVALLDGFNPCAMWTLIFLISLLLGMRNRKRMWLLGIAFIVTSAFVYFLFLSAWLNLFLFLGWVIWVRILIGLVALVAGGYYLKDYWMNKSGSCPVTGSQKKQKVFEKIKVIVQKKQFLLALGGIVLLAIAVNTVELICSAGLPAVYTQILALANLPAWQYYFYLLFYVFIFMLDDLFVFFAAMITLRATGIQTKYARYSHLIGGLLMLIIGLLLLFKPEILMFG